MKRFLLFIFFITTSLPFLQGQALCSTTNSTFKDGEVLDYKVYYNVGFVYVGAGKASFTVNQENHKGKKVWHAVGSGRTLSSYDLFFKVRDRYESYFDVNTLKPLTFVRDIQEGKYTKYNKVDFNHENRMAHSSRSDSSYAIPNCIQDVISAIYQARNIDFSKYKKGEKIPITIFLDNEVSDIYVRYMGKEEVKTKYGKFKAIVFKPFLIKGTVFEGGEQMTVWVTDDKNRIPVRVNSEIVVGSIKVDLIDFKNLRHPMTALIN